MAIATVGAEEVLMCVVVLVAAVAVLRCIPKLDRRLMAVFALRVGVRADKRKVSLVVIESQPVELHNIGIPPFVIGMAAETTTAAGLSATTMETLF